MNDKETIADLRMRLRIAEDALSPLGQMIEGDYAHLLLLDEEIEALRIGRDHARFIAKGVLRIGAILAELKSVPVADSALEEIHERLDKIMERLDG